MKTTELEEKYRRGEELTDDEIVSLISEGSELPKERIEAILCKLRGDEFLYIENDL